jgi:hypothetical protein
VPAPDGDARSRGRRRDVVWPRLPARRVTGGMSRNAIESHTAAAPGQSTNPQRRRSARGRCHDSGPRRTRTRGARLGHHWLWDHHLCCRQESELVPRVRRWATMHDRAGGGSRGHARPNRLCGGLLGELRSPRPWWVQHLHAARVRSHRPAVIGGCGPHRDMARCSAHWGLDDLRRRVVPDPRRRRWPRPLGPARNRRGSVCGCQRLRRSLWRVGRAHHGSARRWLRHQIRLIRPTCAGALTAGSASALTGRVHDLGTAIIAATEATISGTTEEAAMLSCHSSTGAPTGVPGISGRWTTGIAHNAPLPGADFQPSGQLWLRTSHECPERRAEERPVVVPFRLRPARREGGVTLIRSRWTRLTQPLAASM